MTTEIDASATITFESVVEEFDVDEIDGSSTLAFESVVPEFAEADIG